MALLVRFNRRPTTNKYLDRNLDVSQVHKSWESKRMRGLGGVETVTTSQGRDCSRAWEVANVLHRARMYAPWYFGEKAHHGLQMPS